ncbi:MAG: RsmE family RNA methyltransferase [Bacilli bacterium]
MQRYFAKNKQNYVFELDSSDYYHIKTVMRMKDNDKIQIVYKKIVYMCHIENVNNDIKVIIDSVEVQKNNPTPTITLYLPLLKEQKFDFVLQKATELGIFEIVPLITERSIIKIDNEKYDKKITRWQKIVKEASEQSLRDEIPIITEIKNLKQLTKFEGLTILCSTKEETLNINSLLKKNKKCDKINIVIGPEGGLSTKEENFLIDLGASSTTLGNNIMRVETVPIFLLSIINYEYME